MKSLHSQRIHKFQDLLNNVLAMICMWVCVIGGGVGRGGGEEFVLPLIFPFIYFSGVDLPIEGDFSLPRSVLNQAATICMVRCFLFLLVV